MHRHLPKGFTLLELMIVIAIISILMTISIQGIGSFRADGRDARRISDLRFVEQALELYFAKCGFYPGGAYPPLSGLREIYCSSDPLNPNEYSLLDPNAPATWDTMRAAIIGTQLGINSIPNDPLYDPACTANCYPNYEYRRDVSGQAPYLRYLVRTQFENASSKFYNEDIDNDSPGYTSVADFSNPAEQFDCGDPRDLNGDGVADDMWYCIGI